jgi:titin
MRSIKPVFFLRWCSVALLSVFAATISTTWAANFYQGVATNNLPWPGGIVPYVFTTNVSAAEQVVYLDGMREWGLSANIQFVPWTTQTNHVILDLDYMEGTNTYFASVPPVMTIDNLSRAQVCHETGHLLGFQHEHVRIDRNSYIIVNFNNIDTGQTTNSSGEGSGSVTNLYVIDSNSTPNGPYDFESVMHYGRTLFSKDPATLDVLVPQPAYLYEYYNRIGNYALSVGDRAGAAYLYGPPATPLTNIVSTTADGGVGSLRAAMYYANDHPGTTVRFNIPTNDPGLSNGVYTIYPSGQLPPLVANGTVIDATTQPGYAGSPIVALDGSHLSPQIEFSIGGIYIYAGNCTLRGLALDNFTNSGVNLLYNYSASNHVQGCYIGIAPNGTTGASNGYEGINISAGAQANVIGGTNASQRNVISGNNGYAITITSTNSNGNVISGNYIGTDASGTFSVNNTYNGIGIFGGSSSNIIGGSAAGAGNVISGNAGYGIYISDSNTLGTVVQGNFIGTDLHGTNAVPNTYMGVGVWSGAANTLIGGTTAAERNVVSGNGNNGVTIGGAGSGGNVVEGNYIGVTSNGLGVLPNNGWGMYVESCLQSNIIESNVICGNALDGIYLYQSTNNTVQGNDIGVAGNGTTALPNGGNGVYLYLSESNLIGGAGAGEGNVISGNTGGGIFFDEATNNVVQGNDIGVAADGVTARPNNGIGFYVLVSQSNLIGGTVAGAGNVVSANLNDGIQLYGPGTSYNTVEGNLVGTTQTGSGRLGNSYSALSLIAGASSNTIGGSTAAARNILSGSSNYDGVYISDASNNVVEGNYIGTDASGLVAVANAEDGLTLFGASQSNQITGNVISASGNYGVIISDPGTTANLVQGNNIGVGADGTTDLGNTWQGVEIQSGASGNTIGLALDGSGAGNVIAYNSYDGLILYDTNTIGDSIRGNSIYSNGSPAIDLVGANDLESYPVLTSVAVYSNSMVIAGTVTGAASHNILIDIYYNPAADPSGYGQGKTYIGSAIAQTGAEGNGSFSMPFADKLAGQYFSATATDASTGNTSQFSLDVEATNTTGTAPGEFSGLHYASNGFTFDITLATNQNYTIQVSTNLSASPMWVNLTNFFATNSPVQILDSAATNSRARFYRVLTP